MQIRGLAKSTDQAMCVGNDLTQILEVTLWPSLPKNLLTDDSNSSGKEIKSSNTFTSTNFLPWICLVKIQQCPRMFIVEPWKSHEDETSWSRNAKHYLDEGQHAIFLWCFITSRA